MIPIPKLELGFGSGYSNLVSNIRYCCCRLSWYSLKQLYYALQDQFTSLFQGIFINTHIKNKKSRPLVLVLEFEIRCSWMNQTLSQCLLYFFFLPLIPSSSLNMLKCANLLQGTILLLTIQYTLGVLILIRLLVVYKQQRYVDFQT